MTKSLQTMDWMSPGANLNAYIQGTASVPILSLDEERALGEALYYQDDLEAARRLVMSHLRFVVHIARSYNGYGLPLGDLIQEGNVGLMKAVKRFNPEKGARLVSFAVHWIKAEIHEFILRNWKIVKVATTKAQRKLFFNLRSLKRQLNCSDSLTEDDVEKIAETLKVKNHDVEEMNIRLSYSDSSIDYQEENGLSQSLQSSGADPYEILSNDQEQFKIKNTITEALKELDERSKRIIEARWLKLKEGTKPKTLKELADELDVSAERVRQIETAAFKKLKEKLSVH